MKIFLGYTKADHPDVLPIFDLLVANGFDVWWDPKLSDAERWDLSVQRALLEASCVVVVWTPQSIGRFWLHEEARYALRQNSLVQVTFEGVAVPMAYLRMPIVNRPDASTASSWRENLVSAIRDLTRNVPKERAFREEHRISIGEIDAGGAIDKVGTLGVTTAPTNPVAVEFCIDADVCKRWFRPGRGIDIAERFQDLSKSPAMVVVPEGEFVMGAAEGDSAHNERPQHVVRIDKPFAISCCSITFDEWDAYSSCTKGAHSPPDADWGRGRRPVINVSWIDAHSYIHWLSKTTGEAYRLPTEAEWEYCCRAGATTPYSTGDEIKQDQANFSGDGTTEVGAFLPNNWGIFDMHGNVWEWCEDTWHPNYSCAPADGSPWTGEDGTFRVLRGGSWVMFPQLLRSSQRDCFRCDGRAINTGFRIVRSL